jgi:hypothetical protein
VEPVLDRPPANYPRPRPSRTLGRARATLVADRWDGSRQNLRHLDFRIEQQQEVHVSRPAPGKGKAWERLLKDAQNFKLPL